MTTATVTTPELTGAARLEHANASAVKYAQSGILSEEAKTEILEALNGADFAIYTAVHDAWTMTYKTTRECTMEGAQTAWQRFCKEFAIEKPKSTSKEATERAALREAEAKARAALPLAKVEAAKQAAIKAAQDAQTKGDFKAATKANSEAATLQAELVRREKDANKGATDALNAKRKAIKAKLDTANLETLNKIEALLDMVASNATTDAIRELLQRPAPVVDAAPQQKRKAA